MESSNSFRWRWGIDRRFAIKREWFKIEIPRSMKRLHLNAKPNLWHVLGVRSALIVGLSIFAASFSLPVCAQQTDPAPPVVVQPGAPGQPTRRLPPSTRPTLPPTSPKDVEFMQGMIMHHAQAVEMTALIDSHTTNKELRLLGARISTSQSDEIAFMKRWLAARGEPISHAMPSMGTHMPGMDMTSHTMLMPGMLTPKQMEALRKAKGAGFDKLFLTGMIQHHNGALVMVKELFDTAGAGQDAELFSFATDVDSGQRAEIRIMEKMLGK
jgi:uncharacterized protein (DUF305 family)